MRLCSDCDRVIYLVLIFIFLFLSNSCMFSVAVYCFGQVVGSDSKRECCARLWVHASPMTCLSDRNMSLGDVLLPQGGKQRCLSPRLQGLFTLRRVLFNAVVCCFGFTLNTSEMFWIDISRWMISSRCSWISVY